MSGPDGATDADRLDWLRGPLDAWPAFDLVSVVEAGGGVPDRLSVSPRDAEEELATRWITAEEGSFVDVADVR